MQPGAILFSTHHQHSATREFHFPTRKESLLHCSVYIVHLYPSCQFCTLVSESGLIGSQLLQCKPSVLKRRRQSPVSRRGTRMDLSLQRLPTLFWAADSHVCQTTREMPATGFKLAQNGKVCSSKQNLVQAGQTQYFAGMWVSRLPPVATVGPGIESLPPGQYCNSMRSILPLAALSIASAALQILWGSTRALWVFERQMYHSMSALTVKLPNCQSPLQLLFTSHIPTLALIPIVLGAHRPFNFVLTFLNCTYPSSIEVLRFSGIQEGYYLRIILM